MTYPDLVEPALAGAALCSLAGYHLWFALRYRRDPASTHLGRSQQTRRAWVRSVMDERRDILAVQTLRNWTMAATFLASAAILIALGVLNVALTTKRAGDVSDLLSLFGSQSETLWRVKLLVLGVTFFFSFFSFTLAVRYYNHAGFMINVPSGADSRATPEEVAATLNRGALHYNLGMRGYYVGIPLALWLLGPLWLLAGSVALVLAIGRLDRVV